MTIKVYEVTREGSVRVVRPAAEVVPVKIADETFAFPVCECPRCVPRPK